MGVVRVTGILLHAFLLPRATLAAETLALFIRLGIGRAAYAYRLAYGKLPDSLEALAQSGIMAERHVKDENGVPLEHPVEDGCFVVTSPAQPGWAYR